MTNNNCPLNQFDDLSIICLNEYWLNEVRYGVLESSTDDPALFEEESTELVYYKYYREKYRETIGRSVTVNRSLCDRERVFFQIIY